VTGKEGNHHEERRLREEGDVKIDEEKAKKFITKHAHRVKRRFLGEYMNLQAQEHSPQALKEPERE
jgi:polyphosphate kinase